MPNETKLANPGPLGLCAFGVTTIVLSCINAGFGSAGRRRRRSLAFAYGGLAQFIAGFLEFQTGNTFGLVAFTSYGAFWWWFAFLQWSLGAHILTPPSGKSVVALTLLVWGIFTFLLWIVTFRSNKAVWSIFLLLWITFVLLAMTDFGYLSNAHLGGYVGLLTGIDALLVGFIEVYNASSPKPISLGTPILS